jgi:glycosyltransferase involved in cell wall biosynthesis
MRLGLVGPLPPPNGGMALQTVQLARLLGIEGVEVDLLQTNAPYRPAIVGHLWGVRALFRLVPYLWRAWRLAGRVDVIHLMANSGWSWQLFAAPVLWLGWFRGTPVIVNYRGGEAREYLAASARWVRPSLSRACELVVPSGFLKQVFGDHGFDASVIPNIIDLETFSPSEVPGQRQNFTLVITRNLETIYGLDTAIHAVALLRKDGSNLRLRIAGSGPQREDLRKLTQELGVTSAVEFLGRLSRSEIVELYRDADAMLNPSRVDNMPNSVLEALACGVPVISTNVGGVPFIVRDGETALLVDPDDAAGMAAAVSRLADDAGLRAALSERGQREVARYAWPEVRQQWLALYRQHGAAI